MLEDQALEAGTEIGGYTIRRVLGAGSFGITYLAYDKALSREVALKEYFPTDYAMRAKHGRVTPRNVANASEVFAWGLERFSAEARTLARFRHPNIVGVLQLITDVHNTAYIAMELLGGRPLEDHVHDDGVPDAERFLAIFNQLLDGVEAIHRIGILHRDIKPSNVVMQGDQPVLIDFGSALELAVHRGEGFSAVVSDGYSPPEQYVGSSAQGPYTDIYALAATAIFTLTGAHPPSSAGRARGEAVQAVPADRAEALWPSFLTGLDQALSLDPADRPQTIADWRAALGTRPMPEVAPPGRLGRRALLLGGAGLVVAGATGFGAFRMLTGEPISDSALPLAIGWRHSVGPTLASMASSADPDPFPQVIATPGGAMLAAFRVGSDGVDRGLALRLDDAGKLTGSWLSGASDTRFHAIAPAPDGGAFVGGRSGTGEALLARLGPGWEKLWEKPIGTGSITSLVAAPEGGVICGIEDKNFNNATLIIIAPDGTERSKANVSIDPTSDSVQRLVALPGGGHAVLGLRIDERARQASGGSGVSLWVAILDAKLQEVIRPRITGLGAARGWDIAAFGDYIYVTGNTDDGSGSGKSALLVACLDGKGNTLWSKWDYAGAASGRSITVSPDGYLFVGGGGGDPRQPLLLQVGQGGAAVSSQPAVAGPGVMGTINSLSIRSGGAGFATLLTYATGSVPQLDVVQLKS